ncbi:DoxX family protein [Alteriqipengyuania sp. 357]
MARIATRWFLVIAYFAAGVLHIAVPEPFLGIMPRAVPFPEAMIFWTGVAEILGAIGLAQAISPQLRRAAGIGLALYALCVWPANIQHMISDLGGDGGLGLAYHVPRMLAQPIIIWAALWAGCVIDWPFARRA